MIPNQLIIIDNVLFGIQTYPLLPTLILIVLLSIVWDIFFIKKIKLNYTLFSEASCLSASDFSGNQLNIASQHKIEVIKYSFLLALSICEITSACTYGLGTELADILFQTNGTIEYPNKFANRSCVKEFIVLKNLQLSFLTEIPLVIILVSIGQVCLLLSFSFGICLMKFLYESYYEKTGYAIKWIKRLIFATFLLCIFILIFGSIPQLLIIHHIFEPIIQFIFFCLWLKYVRIFYRLLKRKTLDARIMCFKKRVLKQLMINEKQFALIMFLNIIGGTCFILSEFIAQYSFIFSTILYFGPCLFTYLFGTDSYAPILDQHQSEGLYAFILVINIITTILVIIACISIGAHYCVASFIYFGGMLVNNLKIRFGMGQRTRYTPDPSHPLLFQHQIRKNYTLN